MALKKASRAAQYPLVQEFNFSFNDTAPDAVTGAVKGFGTTIAEDLVFDAINMPQGAVVCGGELIVETAGVGPTAYTAKLGVAGDDACFLAASDLKAAANTRYALLLTKQLAANDAKNLRLTMASTVAVATAGKFRLRVMYTIDGKSNEVIPN